MDMEDMIDRFYTLYSGKIKGTEKKKLFVLPKSDIHHKKTYFSNFTEFCESVNIKPVEVANFFESELNAKVSIIKGGMLAIKNRYDNEQIKSTIRKYIEKYLRCPVCRKTDTTIIKENKVTKQKCNLCLAESVID
jgi:translation initiation factor 2 subunit 2